MKERKEDVKDLEREELNDVIGQQQETQEDAQLYITRWQVACVMLLIIAIGLGMYSYNSYKLGYQDGYEKSESMNKVTGKQKVVEDEKIYTYEDSFTNGCDLSDAYYVLRFDELIPNKEKQDLITWAEEIMQNPNSEAVAEFLNSYSQKISEYY